MGPDPKPASIRIAIIALAAACLAAATAGCAPPPTLDFNTTQKIPVEATGTAEATMAIEATGSADGTASTAPSATGPWPAKAATFAKNFKAPVWWPTYLPAGFKLDVVDVIEYETGSGLVLDCELVSGEKAIIFTQGSPKLRDPDPATGQKVPWGTESADVMYEDPSDTTSAKYLIYNAKGTLVELGGDVPFEQLKAMAASMVLVK